MTMRGLAVATGRKAPAWAGLVAALLILAGCGQGEAESGASAAAPAGPPKGPPPTPVVTYEVKPETVTREINLIGTLVANERVAVQSKFSGRVESIGFDEGGHVERGQILFELDRQDREAQLAEAQADLELARANLERAQFLVQSNGISQQELDRNRTAVDAAQAVVRLRQQNLDDAIIRAPFDAVVGSRSVSIGQYVNSGQTLTTLVDLQRMKMDFEVPERYLSFLSVGQSVAVRVVAYPQKEFAGRVYFVSSEVDARTRTILVRAELQNPEELLKPGMFGKLRLLVEKRENAVVVPEEAIMQRGQQTMVAVVGADNRAEFRPVDLGLRLEGRVEILKGLQMGDKVVTRGHQKFGPGMTLKVTEQS